MYFPEEQQNQVRTMLSCSLKGIIAQLLIPQKDGKGRVAVNELLFYDGSLAQHHPRRSGAQDHLA